MILATQLNALFLKVAKMPKCVYARTEVECAILRDVV